jgi:hypothetical protein
MNEDVPKEMSNEAKDAEKSASAWKTSLQYAKLREGEICLADWQ